MRKTPTKLAKIPLTSVLSIKFYVYLLHRTAYITFIIHNMNSRYIIVRSVACCLLLTHSIGVAQAQKGHRSTRKVQTQPLFHVNDTLPIVGSMAKVGAEQMLYQVGLWVLIWYLTDKTEWQCSQVCVSVVLRH